MSGEVIIYTKPGCPYCAAAKQDMNDRGVAFLERDVTADSSVRDEAIGLAGRAAVPVIVIDEEVTVGFGGS
jgi:glutaredoxin 3